MNNKINILDAPGMDGLKGVEHVDINTTCSSSFTNYGIASFDINDVVKVSGEVLEAWYSKALKVEDRRI